MRTFQQIQDNFLRADKNREFLSEEERLQSRLNAIEMTILDILETLKGKMDRV